MAIITSAIVAGQDNEDYTDLFVYIRDDNGAEWRYSVSLDKESNTTYQGDIAYAPSLNAAFDDTSKTPGVDVQAAFNAVKPEMLKMLGGKHE